jgi:hypothetical protein
MTYKRVLPRDLFNEAKLLKCVGKLTLLIEDGFIPNMSYHYDGDPFDIHQVKADGSIFIGNISVFKNGAEGGTIDVFTPLNSKAPWPLIGVLDDYAFRVFDDNGELNQEFIEYINS